MPWHIAKSSRCEASHPWAVIKDTDDSVAGCHATKQAAQKQMAALYANEPQGGMMSSATEEQTGGSSSNGDFPRDSLIRATFPGDLELRETENGGMPTLAGHFAVFGQWTTIDSVFEGRFLERIAPGAFKKTFQENTPSMRVLFQHGRDPQIGNKPLGAIASVEEDDHGARYEVPLLDTSYNRDLLPGLRAGVYGASFRFKVMKEDIDRDPGESDWNPDGLPERTIQEARVMEFGPVTFPAYEGATAGVRSLTDDFLFGQYAAGTATAERADDTTETDPPDGGEITTTAEAEPQHSDEPSRGTPTDDDRRANQTKEEAMSSIAEMQARQEDIRQRLEEIAAENTGRILDETTRAEWDGLVAENDDLDARIKEENERQEYLRSRANAGNGIEDGGRDTGVYVTKRDAKNKAPDDVFDMTAYHANSRDYGHQLALYEEGARKAIEQYHYPHPSADREKVSAHLETLVRGDALQREIAQRVLIHGSPNYRAAFWKTLLKQPLSRDEQAAFVAGMSLEARALTTTDTGGVTVPVQIDPTVILSSNGVMNPFRQISRIVTTTSHQWQAVTSTGITAQYRAEGALMTDNAPSFVAPAITPERADAFVPFSWEAGADWSALETEMARALQDAKDTLEATQFAVGSGSNAPKGILVAAGTIIGTAAATAFAVGDVYALENALPARFQSGASWLATNALFQRVRQFDTAGGASIWADNLRVGQPATLLGYAAYKASTVGTAGAALTASARWGIIGDFQQYVIVDRVGLQIRFIDTLVAGTSNVLAHAPTGQSAIVAYWRNSADVTTSNAFRVGTIN